MTRNYSVSTISTIFSGLGPALQDRRGSKASARQCFKARPEAGDSNIIQRMLWNPTLRKEREEWGIRGVVSKRKAGKGEQPALKLLRGSSYFFGCGYRHMNLDRRAAVFVKQLAACGLDDRFPDLANSVAGFFIGRK